MVVLTCELNQKCGVSMAIFLADSRSVASGIDLFDLSNECRAGEENATVRKVQLNGGFVYPRFH